MTQGVYVIRRQSGQIKIGVSGNVRIRLSMLQNASTEPLFLDYSERVVGDAAVLERQVHETLGAHRLDDEWYDVSTEQAIETIREAAQTLGFELSPWPPKVVRASLKREKTTVVNMRFDPEILAKIDAEAKQRGMSRIAWLHWVASSALGAE